MGGRLVLTKISSNGEIKSSKIGTWFLNKMNSVKLLDEKYFDIFCQRNNLFSNEDESNIKNHDDYESDNALFAPYHYGIVVLDFKHKKVFSLNGYTGFLGSGTKKLFREYEQLGHSKQLQMEIQNFDGEIIRTESFLEENSANINSIALITSCVEMKADLFINDRKYTIEEDDDYFSFVSRLYGQDLSLLTLEESNDYIIKNYENKDKYDIHGEYVMKGWSNISVKLPGWDIIENHLELNDTIKCFDFYKEKNLLTEEEMVIWDNELKILTEREKE